MQIAGKHPVRIYYPPGDDVDSVVGVLVPGSLGRDHVDQHLAAGHRLVPQQHLATAVELQQGRGEAGVYPVTLR